MGLKDLKKEIRWFWNTELNRRKTQVKEEPEEKVLALNSGENKQIKIIVISSRANVTSVSSKAIERQDLGETKTTTETTIRVQEIPVSTRNATTVVKEVTGQLIVG